MDIQHLNSVREAELGLIRHEFPAQARLLEIGGGTGEQALRLSRLGYKVTSIDLATSRYGNERVFPIIEYDGRHIPFPDKSFDIIFSSNVLEHIADLDGIHREFRRVLVPQGYCVHVMPTPTWRFWSMLTHFPEAAANAWAVRGDVLPRGFSPSDLSRATRGIARMTWRLVQPFRFRRHGERGNAVTELILFRAKWWRRVFTRNGFRVEREKPVGLFYTGSSILGRRLDKRARTRLSALLGSACRLYVTRPTSSD
jgi:SAM-dependent methyltransferase